MLRLSVFFANLSLNPAESGGVFLCIMRKKR